jgi:hypothetical protein
MSRLENTAEYFGASFQDDQVNKLGNWTENNRITAIQKTDRTRIVVREEKLDAIRARLETLSRKSLKRLAQATSVS